MYTSKSDGVEGGLGKRVILDLSKTLEGKKYHLYFDNFFSSVSLMTTLLEKGLYACGTRQNYRDFPSALKMQGKSKAEMQRHGLANRLKKYLYCICIISVLLYVHVVTQCTCSIHVTTCTRTFSCRGDSEMVQWEGVVAFLWRNNRVVTVLSTNTQPQQHDIIQRREHDGTRSDVPCPVAMALYNMYMGGVDRNDQFRQYYHVRLKCHKFYRYVFWFFFEVAVANAHILHTHYPGRARQPYKEFRLELAKGLVGEYHSKKRHNRHSAPPTNLPFRHFPVKYETNDTIVRCRCSNCWNKRQPQRRRDTAWYCHECQIYLCHTGVVNSDCFLQHHKD